MTASGIERLLFEGVEWRGVERWSFRCNLFDGTPNERGGGWGGGGGGERERQRERQEEEEEVCDFCVAKSPQETGRLFQRMGVMILMT